MYLKPHTFQAAASATGNGTALSVEGLASLAIDVTITNTATVAFEAAGASGTFVALPVVNCATGAVVTTATATGLFRADVAALTNVRVRVSAWTSGTVTVTGMAADQALGIASPATAAATTVDTELPAASSVPSDNSELISGLSLPLVRVLLAIRDGNGLINTSLLQGSQLSLDAQTASSFLGLHTRASLAAWDGTSIHLLRTNAAAVLSGATQPKGLLTSSPGEWTITHAPAANTVASVSKAAGGAGVRHVCSAISAVVAAGGTAPTATTVTLQVRDGASGAGTVVWSHVLGIEATAGRTTVYTVSGLELVGSANTAMTIEFTGAGGANTFESVSLSGYSTV